MILITNITPLRRIDMFNFELYSINDLHMAARDYSLSVYLYTDEWHGCQILLRSGNNANNEILIYSYNKHSRLYYNAKVDDNRYTTLNVALIAKIADLTKIFIDLNYSASISYIDYIKATIEETCTTSPATHTSLTPT